MERLAPPVLGATAGAVLAGALWTAAMPLGVVGAWVVGVHALLGAGLGAVLALAPWTRVRSATSALVLALLLAGALPLGIAALAGSEPSSAPSETRHHPVTDVTRAAAPAAARLVVVGLDGADWSVIDPLLAAGELPHLAELVARGRTAVLRSIEPTQSPVVWTSIFSGRTPDEHGITGWSSSHTANRRAALLWEMAGAAGLPSVVVNVPGTWPPTAVDGALVSGFPIPGALVHAGRDRRLAQSIGVLIAEGERSGPLETARVERDAEGRLRARVSFGSWLAPPTGLRHFAIDAAIRHGWLPLPEVALSLSTPDGDEELATWTANGGTYALARESWSPWIEIASPAGPLHVRLRRLGDDALFATPAFQDPGAPIHPYTSSPAVRDAVADLGPYVVEPAGWKSADDPAVRDAVLEHLIDVEAMHLRAGLALRADRPDWSLFVHVVTLPDRVSHAFWRFHRPEDYPPLPAAELAAHREAVVDAYREADRLLGALVADLGPDTTVLVLSDHGFTSKGDRHGDHRLEGVLIAAGPGIAAGAERLTLSVYDVTPLSLALLGLPIAGDFAGELPRGLLTGEALRPRRIASYEADGAAAAPPTPAVTIDPSTEEQLRGLGYIE